MKYATLLSLTCLLLISAPAVADSGCQASIDANPNIIIPVHVERYTEFSSHPDDLDMTFDSYEVKFGAFNEFDTICITHPNAVILFTLPNRNEFEFSDIRFYENGQPSTQIVQTEVHDDYIRVINKNDIPVNIKYVLVLRDKRNGATITRDPDILNDRN